ncbi:unnamed protein product [Rotaria sp. Silwood1]|nr:unnamed protein product [Rotaria sp. Silwood1]CAF4836974.1 unnamed protein product [Rotaria sp. Silwood1]
MNLTMQQPISYPFYMESPRLRFSLPWSPNPFQYPTHSQQYFSSSYPAHPPISYPLPFILSHPPHHNPPSKPSQPFSSYSNTRYNHLKQSTSHMNRHRSIDTPLHSQRYSIANHPYQSSKTKSMSNFQQNSTNLLKAHSWHSMNHLYQSNLNMNYEKEMSLNHENHYYNSYLPKQNKQLHKRHLSSSPKRKQTSKQDIVRITTLDEIPIINNPIYQEDTINSIKNKNRSTPIISTKQPSPLSSSSSSSLSTCSSHSSLQKILNGSLRHDPLLNAAMEDFRQLRQTSSRSTSLTPHHRDLSRDSLCSGSTHHLSAARSRSRSHSSFTSLERLEIRNLIKTLKTNGLQSLNIPVQLLPNSLQSTEKFLNKKTSSSILTINKPEKSSITEELEREFSKLRSNNPNQELIYVKPSLIKKEKKSNSSLSIDDKSLNKKQHETNDSSILKHINEKTYKNPILSIPISQISPKHSSKVSPNDETNYTETKPEYAIPIKKNSDVNLRSIKKDEQIRSFSFCKPISDIDNEVRQTRPLSMFNWLHCGLTNPFPTTFQPIRITNNNNNNNNEYEKSLVKENIYASDIDVHIPLPDDKDYLNNQTLMTDYLSDYKQTTNSSSIFSDLSRLFTRFGNNKHEHKSKCKRKLHKNNNNLRCSIM